jgi:hypothetical protein
MVKTGACDDQNRRDHQPRCTAHVDPLRRRPAADADAGCACHGATAASTIPGRDIATGSPAAAGHIPVDIANGNVPCGDIPTGDVPLGNAPCVNVPVGNVPVGNVSVGIVSLGNVSVGTVSVGNVSLGNVPGGNVPAAAGRAADLAAAGAG